MGFCGWQAQARQNTIQQLLDEALRDVGHRGPRCVGCSRTDAGVHARFFTAHLDTTMKRPAEVLLAGLNAKLPAQIRVWRISRAAPTFNARFSCSGKAYRYHIFNGRIVPPFIASYVYHRRGRLDLPTMAGITSLFTGEHDFASFTTGEGRKRDTTRRLDECRLEEKGAILVLHVKGPSFLHRMVRRIAGAVLAAGAGRLAPEEIVVLLGGYSESPAVPALPARGLVLWQVSYPEEFQPVSTMPGAPPAPAFPL